MSFATSLDTWLIASAWLATNAFGFNMSSLGLTSYWVIPLGYLVTLYHHGHLFRDLRRDPSLPIRRSYKFLFPCMIFVWFAGGFASIFSAVFFYRVGEIGGVGTFQMIAITATISGAMAWTEAILLAIVWSKCRKFKSNVGPSRSVDDFDRAGTKA